MHSLFKWNMWLKFYCFAILRVCHSCPRTARVEQDWTQTWRQLGMTADFCPIYFNDCTALLGLITMEPVIQSHNFFLIHDQGHILSNSISSQNVVFPKHYPGRPKVIKFTTMTVLHFDFQYLLILSSNPTKLFGFDYYIVILPNCGKKLCQKLLSVRVTEKYPSCPVLLLL
jgi:hypothetical protein